MNKFEPDKKAEEPILHYYSNSALYCDAGKYYYAGSEWEYLIRISKHFSKIIVITRLTEERSAKYQNRLDIGRADIFSYNDVRTNRAKCHLSTRPTLVFLMGPSWTIVRPWIACLIKKIPYAVCLRGEWEKVMDYGRLASIPGYRFFRPMLAWIIRSMTKSMLRRAQFPITNVYKLRDELKVSGKQVHKYVDVFPEELPAVQEKTGTATEHLRLISVGSLVERKGVSLLLEACAKLKSRDLFFNLKIVGDGPLRESLENQARELDLAEVVTFLGNQNEAGVSQAFLDSDVLVLSSYSEGFPRVIIEAFAHGVAVIATRVGGIPYELEHMKSAFLIKPGNIDDIVTALEHLRDKDLLIKLRNNGNKYIEDLKRNPPIKLLETEVSKYLDNERIG